VARRAERLREAKGSLRGAKGRRVRDALCTDDLNGGMDVDSVERRTG
jgi:hypothetical protein